MKKREEKISGLNRKWDIIIIGGGITGAGIFREASKKGLSCLLLEQNDFGAGTSSRSGKLVHGGLRYLKQGHIGLTWHSVRERERLLRFYEGLVEPLEFLAPIRRKDYLSKLMLKIGLSLYDIIALNWHHGYKEEYDFSLQAPALKGNLLSGGFNFRDARTDDARLVLQIIKEGETFGGTALNYFIVNDLIKDKTGKISGVISSNLENGDEIEIEGQIAISAAGAWTDKFRNKVGKKPCMRLLSGSHLIFPRWRVPIPQAVVLTHPVDGRSMYIFPWEGVTLLGTTDIDYNLSLNNEPRISAEEGNYLLEAVNNWFPTLNLTKKDVLSTFSGVRPVINTGKKNPSQESREHAIWADNGLIIVTGGKLTTFGLIARMTLKEANKQLSTAESLQKKYSSDSKKNERVLKNSEIDIQQIKRISGRYGSEAFKFLHEAEKESLKKIEDTDILWSELSWAAKNENVVHLDDLLLRRTRLGLLVPKGGANQIAKIKTEVQPKLNWDNERWKKEIQRYLNVWEEAYNPNLIT